MEFKDLIWNKFDPSQAHCLSWWDDVRLAGRSKEARVKFDNGYSCRILKGKFWKSNGVDNYEVQVYRGNSRYSEEPKIPEDGGYLDENKISEILKYVESLKPYKKKRNNTIPLYIEQTDLTYITQGWIKSEMDRLGIGIKQIHSRTGIGKNILRKIIIDQDEDYLVEDVKIALLGLFRYLEETKNFGFCNNP